MKTDRSAAAIKARTEAYLRAYRALKAAIAAYNGTQTYQLLDLVVDASNDFVLERIHLAATLGATPPDPHLPPPGVSQTHCIK